MERALLWLHEQEVIRLNKGLTVFRSAMTIRLGPGGRPFTKEDFESLQLHYDESTRQVHVMAEYAQTGLRSMVDAVRLSLDYFALGEAEFSPPLAPEQAPRDHTPDHTRVLVDDR